MMRRRRRRRRRRGKSALYRKAFAQSITIFIIIIGIIAGIAGGMFVYNKVNLEVSKGSVGYCLQGDKLQISWRSAGKSMYRLSRYDEQLQDFVFCGEYGGGGAELTDVEPGKELTLKMQRVRTVNVFGQVREMVGKERVLTVVPEELDSPVLTKTVDAENNSVRITWDAEEDRRYEVYLMNEEGSLELYSEVEGGGITFSTENREELLGREKVMGVAVRAIRRTDEYTLYGSISNMSVIERADLMDDDIYLVCEDNGEGHYTLSWQESKGDWYEVQEWSYTDKRWISRQVYQWSDTLSYETGRIPSCTKVRYRVISYNSTELRDKEIYEAEPSEVSFRTELSPVYCTVWPLTALKISEDASGKNVTGQIPAGKALCVLEETEGRFLVRYNDEYGYIDSRYCLIDLAEYMGNLCQYNITNSYSSIFRVNGYYIPEITDTVIKGYENIHMENGNTLVPYLYPCAQKLYKAALLAEEDGYYLRIYDAFRPNEATRYLYDSVEVLLNEQVVEKEDEPGADSESEEEQEEEEEEEPIDVTELTDVSGSDPLPVDQEEKIKFILERLNPATAEILKGLTMEGLTVFYILPQELLTDMSLITPETLEELGEEYTAAFSVMTPDDVVMLQSLPAEDIPILKELTWEELTAMKAHLDNVLTYWQVMTDGGRFRLGSFLAQTVSTHNRGIALDLTLNDASTDEDLEMQTDMHDLSWYSILSQNNENADKLAAYMKGVGYHDLSSEWWHFQDDETRYALNLGYMEKGISPEGWKKDEIGWRYRQEDGSYYSACTVVIEEKERTFNEDGYLIEQ